VLADEGLDEAVAALRTFALVEREPIVDERDPAITTDAIRLPRLVRVVAASRCDSAAWRAVRAVSGASELELRFGRGPRLPKYIPGFRLRQHSGQHLNLPA
jgi:hypothetical protein